MATDDERREVAERLRSYGKEFGDPTWRELCNVVLYDEDRYPSTVRKLRLIDRLADLIDPDCEEGRYEGVHTARPVDREELLVLADRIDHHADLRKRLDMDIETMVARAWAQRIREACGMVDAG